MIETPMTLNHFICCKRWWFRFRVNPINLRSLLFSLNPLCEAHDSLLLFFSDSINLKSNFLFTINKMTKNRKIINRKNRRTKRTKRIKRTKRKYSIRVYKNRTKRVERKRKGQKVFGNSP